MQHPSAPQNIQTQRNPPTPHHPLPHILDIIIIILFFRRQPLTPAIQAIHTDTITLIPSLHTYSLTTGFRALQELTELLLANLNSLGRCRVGHAEHGTPEVEGIGNICCHTEKDEEDEVDGIAQHCDM